MPWLLFTTQNGYLPCQAQSTSYTLSVTLYNTLKYTLHLKHRSSQTQSRPTKPSPDECTNLKPKPAPNCTSSACPASAQTATVGCNTSTGPTLGPKSDREVQVHLSESRKLLSLRVATNDTKWKKRLISPKPARDNLSVYTKVLATPCQTSLYSSCVRSFWTQACCRRPCVRNSESGESWRLLCHLHPPARSLEGHFAKRRLVNVDVNDATGAVLLSSTGLARANSHMRRAERLLQRMLSVQATCRSSLKSLFFVSFSLTVFYQHAVCSFPESMEKGSSVGFMGVIIMRVIAKSYQSSSESLHRVIIIVRSHGKELSSSETLQRVIIIMRVIAKSYHHYTESSSSESLQRVIMQRVIIIRVIAKSYHHQSHCTESSSSESLAQNHHESHCTESS